MPSLKVPRGLGEAVRVQEKKSSKRVGTIIKLVGPKRWKVRFDDEEEGSFKELPSASLKIYRAAYGNPKSPVRVALASVRKAMPTTGIRLRRRTNNQGADSTREREQNNEESDSSSRSNGGAQDSTSESESQGSPSLSFDSTFTPQRAARKTNALDSILSSLDTSLATPRPRKSAEDVSNGIQLFPSQASPSSESSNDSEGGEFSAPEGDDLSNEDGDFFAPEGEGGELDDGRDKEEDDDCMGDRITVEDEDGEMQVVYIDEPQKAAAYKIAKERMVKEKKAMIDKGHIFNVVMKQKPQYVPDGRVEGRAASVLRGQVVTILEVVNERRFRIAWDDGSETEASKGQMRLVKDQPKTFVWKVVRDHKAEKQPTTYSQLGVVDFKSSSFGNLDRESHDYMYPFMELLMVSFTV